MNKTDKIFQEKEGIVSLIIPVYNNERTLSTVFREISRIRSILRDRWYIKLEVIFIDDKSKDNSKKAINDFANTNEDTKVLMNKKNIGAIRSVYRGITISKGDCILSMAADLQDPLMRHCQKLDCRLQVLGRQGLPPRPRRQCQPTHCARCA